MTVLQRALAQVALTEWKGDGMDAGAHQVSAGMAWVFDRYSKPSSPLYPLQAEAQAAHRGLWTDNELLPSCRFALNRGGTGCN